jgi:hypothetical protein
VGGKGEGAMICPAHLAAYRDSPSMSNMRLAVVFHLAAVGAHGRIVACRDRKVRFTPKKGVFVAAAALGKHDPRTGSKQSVASTRHRCDRGRGAN